MGVVEEQEEEGDKESAGGDPHERNAISFMPIVRKQRNDEKREDTKDDLHKPQIHYCLESKNSDDGNDDPMQSVERSACRVVDQCGVPFVAKKGENLGERCFWRDKRWRFSYEWQRTQIEDRQNEKEQGVRLHVKPLLRQQERKCGQKGREHNRHLS